MNVNINLFILKFWRRYDWFVRDCDQRMGQARMNALGELAPDLYEIISGSDADCFYLDGRIDAFDLEVFGKIYAR